MSLQATNLEGVSSIAEDTFTNIPIQHHSNITMEEDAYIVYKIMRKCTDIDDNRAFKMLKLAFDKGCTDRVYELCLCYLQ